ncbi:MAG TPA: phosphoglycolate phosphatase [Burkholderiaceae bacterium]|nr:phosphoglycolate phosphatase [Burkholderiaceae bacterium]
MASSHPIQAALIDLDGTLLDTVDDIAAAGNAMRAEQCRPPLSRETAAAYVGQGARSFVARCLADSLEGSRDEALIDRWLPRFLHHYALENGRYATLYPHVLEGLQALRAQRLKLACVTNKPRSLTVALLERFKLAAYFDAVVAGGDTERKKPDPQPVMLACERLNVLPRHAAMVGDSINDAQAGRAAGCAVLLVPYGYNEGRPVEAAQADAIVTTLARAAQWIADRNASSTIATNHHHQ